MAPLISAGSGGTGPLNLWTASQRVQGPAPSPLLSTAPLCPAVSVGPRQYQQADMAAVAEDIQFDPASARARATQDLINLARTQPRALSPEQQTQLQALTEGLGFPNIQSLAHGLRHIPAEALNEWARSLPAELHSDTLTSARDGLRTLAESETRNFFSRYSDTPPRFTGRDGREWCAQSYLSVLNSFTQMAGRLPHGEMQRLVSGNGNTPLTFERFAYQNPSDSTDLLELLSESMRIAYISDDRNTVYLGDATLNMNPGTLIQNTPALQDFMAQINRHPPSEAHVASLHRLLNASRSEHRQLEPGSALTPATFAAVREFEVQQYLAQALDILQDDQSISPAQRQAMGQRVQSLQQRTLERGLSANWQTELRNGLFTQAQLSQLSPQSQERFTQLRSLTAISESGNQLNQAQLELLIGNWFGIIDEGHQRDFAEQAVTHEMGHRLHDMAINGARNPLLADWEQISFQHFERPQAQSELMAATLRPDASNEFASVYGRSSADEDFAESFRLFVQNPSQLRQSNPLKYMFLAGATGTYRGREQELIENLRAAGHSSQQLQDAVLTLRGQHGDYAAQKAQTLTDRAGQVVRAMPLVGEVMRGLSALGLSDRAQNVFTGFMAERAATRDRHFDVSVASMLPGMERQLNMQPVRAVSPTQPHYVLDTLSLWASDALGPEIPVRNRSEALGRLERFAREGLAAFPREVRSQIPPQIQSLLEQPAERARLMSMAYLHATPEIINNSSTALTAAAARDQGHGLLSAQAEQRAMRDIRSATERINDCDTFMQGLRQFMGNSLFEQIPAGVRLELADPNRRQALSGYGLTQVSGRVQAAAMENALANIRSTVSSIVEDTASRIGGLLERHQSRPNTGVTTQLHRELNTILQTLSTRQLRPADLSADSLMQAIEQALQPTQERDAPRSREELQNLVVDILADRIPHIAAQTG